GTQQALAAREEGTGASAASDEGTKGDGRRRGADRAGEDEGLCRRGRSRRPRGARNGGDSGDRRAVAAHTLDLENRTTHPGRAPVATPSRITTSPPTTVAT